MKLILSDKEKYARDKMRIKEIVEHYVLEGETQVLVNEEKIKRLYNLANGVMVQEDYVDYKEERDVFANQGVQLDDAGLSFYPIIPNLINGILGDFDKRHSEYFSYAVNPEHSNQILEKLTEELRTNLIQAAEALFLTEETTEEDYQKFLNSDKIQNYYLKEYRSTVEQWANHTMNVDRERLKMKSVEREILKQLIVTESPILHVNYLDGNYRVEVIKEKDFFKIQSPNNNDLSLSQVAGWFEYMTVDTVLNQYANFLKEEDVERLVHWGGELHGSEFIINGVRQTGNRTEFEDSLNNWRNFTKMNLTQRRYDDFQSDLVRVTNMYFIIPRRVGRLYYKGDGVEFSQLVSDDFKVTLKPYYSGKKSVENLTYGEHVEWFFVNELWRSISIDVTHRPKNTNKLTEDENTIWVFLDKNPIQYSDPDFRFGIRMPIHGGPTTNFYSDPISGVEKAAPLQVMYNWLWNRMQQILSTEVGKFIIINQNMIPQESFDGHWGQNNLLKWFMVAHDTSIAPADPSVTNMGSNAAQISGGFGQVVDMTKTQELLEKAALAREIKMECYQQFGFTPQSLYGEMSPQQSAKSAALQVQRSLTQIQHYYTRVEEIMKMAWNTILETAQFKVSNDGTDMISYMGSDEARTIFKTQSDGFLMHKLNTFVRSSAADLADLEMIKQIALNNNTLGTDLLESAAVAMAKSTPEIMSKLKSAQQKREKQEAQIRQEQAQQQQQLLEQQGQQQKEFLAMKAEQDEINFQRDVVLAQIKATGYGNDSAGTIADEVQKLAKQDLEQAKYESTLAYRDKVDAFKRETFEAGQGESQKQRDLQEKIKMKELELKEKDIEARNLRSRAID